MLELLQTAQDVAASKDVLAELFERIGFFFTRLETYTEVTPTAAMTDLITEIMVEVLKIFGIATKELKRGSASEFPIGCLLTCTKLGVEKFLRRLTGMTDMEDALKKLDRLTQEEARMALAEVLKITHSVRDEVKVVDGKVERVEDKVEDIGDKVQVVIDGAPNVFSQSLIPSKCTLSDGNQARGEAKETKWIIQQTATGIDEVKCP